MNKSQVEREREMSISQCPGTPPMRSRKFPWRLCSSCELSHSLPGQGWEQTIEWSNGLVSLGKCRKKTQVFSNEDHGVVL